MTMPWTITLDSHHNSSFYLQRSWTEKILKKGESRLPISLPAPWTLFQRHGKQSKSSSPSLLTDILKGHVRDSPHHLSWSERFPQGSHLGMIDSKQQCWLVLASTQVSTRFQQDWFQTVLLQYRLELANTVRHCVGDTQASSFIWIGPKQLCEKYRCWDLAAGLQYYTHSAAIWGPFGFPSEL